MPSNADAFASLRHCAAAGINPAGRGEAPESRGIAAPARKRPVDHVGSRFADFENLLPLKSATIFNFRGAYDLGERTELTVTIRNLGRVTVEIDRSPNNTIYTQTPRIFSVGIKTRW